MVDDRQDSDAEKASKSTKFAAFQFYPRDFMASGKVARMSLTEVGIYFTLLCYAWLDEGIPADVDEIAKLVRLPPKRFRKLWDGVLSECWVVRRGKLVNPRQERQRADLEAYIASCSKGGENSAKSRRSRYGTSQPLRSDFRSETEVTPNTAFASSSATASSKKEKKESAEPQADSSPVLLTFPTKGNGPKTWDLTEARIAEWATAYPGIDVLAECRRALVWATANGHKTAQGMPKFLVRWLNQAVDRGGRSSVSPSPSRLPAWAQKAQS